MLAQLQVVYEQAFYGGLRGATQFQKTVPLRLKDDSLVIESVELAGTNPVGFEIDTGMNTALSIRKAPFDSLLEKDLILAVRSVPFVALCGVASRRHGVLRDAKFLGYAMKDVPISESIDSRDAVGLELLQRFDWFIDGNSQRSALLRMQNLICHSNEIKAVFRCF